MVEKQLIHFGFCLIMLGLSITDISAQSASETTKDPGLEQPILNTSPLPDYDYDRLDYGMTIGIERTPKGRIWACWVAGGDNDDAFFVLNTSDNDGKTWSAPKLVIDPHNPSLKEKRRTVVGCLWLDPLGRLWLFFDQSMTMFDGRDGNYYTICENPDSDRPVWSKPVRVSNGCTLNKPVVLKDGTWILPVSLWDRTKIKDPYKEAFHELDDERMANVYASTDQGKTWTRRGGVRYPQAQFDEHHVIERKDGTLWMTARTATGLWQSVSTDQGKTWSEPAKYQEHISSRHFIRRLQSGRILLVRHGGLNEKTRFRSKFTAYLSEDDGKTWIGGLMLDERRGISYPDGFQAPDGTLYVSYDYSRDFAGEIVMARFTEQDILDGKFSGKKSKAKILISKPLGLDKLPAPSEKSK
ncbi:sialidase family protein [Dyadobacter sp. CY323]|uniref:sialidase family protein n=1 Tax=Dyadobacter sp. CY323 TaxID=2907302 RepID=UPI001F2A6103|nr:sialidase family protein [Dyadobacter sp. CY323]MCE6990502.1 glycoside hydrolase [Dyadobacter sp. CY323]